MPVSVTGPKHETFFEENGALKTKNIYFPHNNTPVMPRFTHCVCIIYVHPIRRRKTHVVEE